MLANTEYRRELSALRPTKAPTIELLSTSRRQDEIGNRGGRRSEGFRGVANLAQVNNGGRTIWEQGPRWWRRQSVGPLQE